MGKVPSPLASIATSADWPRRAAPRHSTGWWRGWKASCGRTRPRPLPRQRPRPAPFSIVAGGNPARSGFGSKGSTFRRGYRTIASSATRSTMTIGVPGTTEVMQMQLQRRPSGLPDWLYVAIVAALGLYFVIDPTEGTHLRVRMAERAPMDDEEEPMSLEFYRDETGDPRARAGRRRNIPARSGRHDALPRRPRPAARANRPPLPR